MTDSVSATLLSGPLQTERRSDGRRVLLRDLVVALGENLGLGRNIYPGFGIQQHKQMFETVVTVPKGFDTDYSSIPWFAWAVMGRWDRHDLAGVCHDYAYRMQVPRPRADHIWQIVATSGQRRVGPVRGFVGWLGLRLGGWAAYRSQPSG